MAFVRDPGLTWGYSGEAFVLLQRAVETITGQSLEEFAQREVFRPLQMTRSTFLFPKTDSTSIALGDREAAGGFATAFRPSEGISAWSLHTTALDYARFVAALLAGTGLRADLVRQMMSPQIEITSSVAWGLGVGIQRVDSTTSIWHWGDNSGRGYTSYFVAYPSDSSAVVFLTNGWRGLNLIDRVVQQTLGKSQIAPRFLRVEPFDGRR